MLAFTIAGSTGVTVATQAACVAPNNNSTQNEQSETVFYNVTLNLNGGELSGGQNVIQFEANKSYALPTPTKSGHIFVGWYDNAEFNGDKYTQIDQSSATSNKEFWAKWEVNTDGETESDTYKVTLNLNSGKLKDGQDIKSYKKGTAVKLPVPERLGYDFAGWYETSDFDGSPVNEIPATATGNKTYYAKWTPNDDLIPDNSETVFTVSFDLNYNSSAETESKEVKFGEQVAAPDEPKRIGYEFIGWFKSANGTNEYNFSTGVTESFTLYAHWRVKTYSVTLNFNGGKIVSGENITSYTYGECAVLPTLEKDGYTFDGWYEDSSFTSNKITEILNTDYGNKEYYAKWIYDSSMLKVIAVGGYEEGAYIEVNLLNNTSVSDYTVSYKSASNGVDAYKDIDTELVRLSDRGVRADVVGLQKGTYSIRVSVKNKTLIEDTVNVTSYDRSGYAHFKYDGGIGAYNDTGDLKKGAKVVYVTEETKNTVSFKIGSKTHVGIADILANAANLDSEPLAVRIIGTVGAATWNEINYDKGGNYSDGTDYNGNNKLPANKVVGKNGKQLPTDHKDITQDELIKGGYNTLNTSVYSELKGLNSKATWSNGEFDSAWNNCYVTNATNVTVEGIGTDARIFQWGFTWKQCSSIEVRNITFEDYTEDACSFEGGVNSVTMDGFDSNHIWVHHNTFLEGKNYWDVCPEQDKHEGDGATDFKKNAYITVSYNHYVENHKTGLIGGGDEQTTACVTFHHNWYEKCNSRLPLGREANMHMYNNFYDGSTGTNMSLRAGAYALIENCYFKNANNPVTTQEGNNPDKSAKIKGVAKVVNCEFEGCSIGSAYINNNTVYNYSSNTSNRATVVENDNIFSKNFDTDPSVFYYDAANKKSNVSRLDGKSSVPDVVKELAGTHK